jgi:hypothetical protein
VSGALALVAASSALVSAVGRFGTKADAAPLTHCRYQVCLDRIALNGDFRESSFSGDVRVAGDLIPSPPDTFLRVEGLLTEGSFRYAYRFRTSALPAPAGKDFDLTFPLRATLHPGNYDVNFRVLTPSNRDPGEIPSMTRTAVTIRRPIEGVVTNAWTSTSMLGAARRRIVRRPRELWASFVFAPTGHPLRPLRATWYHRGRRIGAVVRRRNNGVIVTYVRVLGGRGLAEGRWLCVLSAGGKVTKRISAVVG